MAGTVTSVDGLLVGAHVCAVMPESREPACTTTDAHGRYALDGLVGGTYAVAARADEFLPTMLTPPPLAAGEARGGVDIVLKRGGMKLTGTVLDVRGGPIARARVKSWGPMLETGLHGFIHTDDAGQFALWVPGGSTHLEVSAESYADEDAYVYAPGRIEVRLTPEAVLAGIVVDERGTPVPEAVVTAEPVIDPSERGSRDVRSDEQGAFRVSGLRPNRYTVSARTAHGYGRGDGSVVVDVAQTLEGIRVTLYPAFRVSGAVTIEGMNQRCKDSTVSLFDSQSRSTVPIRKGADSTWLAEGVAPGTYTVSAGCRGYVSKLFHPDVEVSTQDVSGVTWVVDSRADGVITGRVLDAMGQPVAGARVWAHEHKAHDGLDDAVSDPDGRYELIGVSRGAWEIRVQTQEGVLEPRVTVTTDGQQPVTQDLVLAAGASIAGTVVDTEGRPVSDARIDLRGGPELAPRRDMVSDLDGRFRFVALAADEYRVYAESSLYETPDGGFEMQPDGQPVTLRDGETSTVALVVPTATGIIRGIVTGPLGPEPDVRVMATHEGSGRDSRRTETTAADGKFTLSRLAPGTYSVRALRAGGSEVRVDHVAVGTTDLRVSFFSGASIIGSIVSGGTSTGILTAAAEAVDGTRPWGREEQFLRTSRFAIEGVPPGRYALTLHAGNSSKVIDVEVTSGQRLDVGAVRLENLVSIKGRLLDATTHRPIAGASMAAYLGRGGASTLVPPQTESSTEGRFELDRVPTGVVTLYVTSTAGELTATRDVAGTGVVDLGDITLAMKPH